MRTMMFLLLAAWPPAAIWAQGSPTPGQRDTLQASLIGKSIGGVVFSAKTRIEAMALNSKKEAVFIARWPDARGVERAAVFTRQRLVAAEGQVVDDKYIGSLVDAKVAISDAGQVAYSAIYADNLAAADIGSGVGIFVEKRLVFRLDSGAIPAFSVGDYGYVYIDGLGGGMPYAPTPVPAFPPAAVAAGRDGKPAPCAAPPPKKPGLLEKLKQHGERTLEKQAGTADKAITKDTGGNVDAGAQDTTTAAVNASNQPQTCTAAKGAKQ
jgi:hypothetical protein